MLIIDAYAITFLRFYQLYNLTVVISVLKLNTYIINLDIYDDIRRTFLGIFYSKH